MQVKKWTMKGEIQLEALWAWVNSNKEWLFSGAGAVILTFVVQLLFKKTSASSTQTIRSGDGSTNVQGGRDVNIGTGNKKNDVEQS